MALKRVKLAGGTVVQQVASWVPATIRGLHFGARLESVRPAALALSLKGLMSLSTMVGHALSFTPRVSGSSTPVASPGLAHTGVLTMAEPPLTTRGLQLVHTKFDLSGRYGAASVSAITVAGAAWSNPTNAQGSPNGTVASHAGAVTSPQEATLYLTFPTLDGKSSLTLTQVQLAFFVRQTGVTLNNGNLQLLVSTDGGQSYTPLEAYVSNMDALTNPLVYTISGVTMATLGSVRAAVYHRAEMGALTTASVDAVELRITATRTDTP